MKYQCCICHKEVTTDIPDSVMICPECIERIPIKDKDIDKFVNEVRQNDNKSIKQDGSCKCN